jgi:hypothetical protein
MTKVVGAALVATLLLLPGCSTSSCPYGRRGDVGSSCSGRGKASAHESTGWHTASLRARIPDALRQAGPRVVQISVNQYGELWAYTGHRDHVVIDVDGHTIEPKEDDSSTGREPFASAALRADAIDHAMEYIAPRAPGFSFISGELYRGLFRRDKGLRWHLTVYSASEHRNRVFLAAPNGRVLCEHLLTGDATTFVPVSGQGCPDPGF